MQATDQQLFLATTPYHVLLSGALAEESSKEYESHLLILPYFADAEKLTGALRGSSLFSSIVNFTDGRPTTYLELRKAIRHIKEYVGQYTHLRRLAVFNDRHHFIQAAMHQARQSHPDVRITYLEDGSAAYSSKRFSRDILGLSTLALKLAYGPWSQHIRCLGTSQWVDDILAIFPAFIRPELQGRPIRSIDRTHFQRIATAEWTNHYLEMQGIEPGLARSSFDMMLLAPHSKQLQSDEPFRETIRSVVMEAARQGLRIAVKYHPREPLGDYLSIDQYPDCLALPNGTPAELFFMRSGNHMPLLVGGNTTSLITARWLLESSIIISLGRLMQRCDNQLISLFQQLSIVTPSTSEEVSELILASTTREKLEARS